MKNMIVAENLKNIRISKNWTQEFVANQLGVSQRTISRAECGEQISRRTLTALCNLYQVESSVLYKESTPSDTSKTKVMVTEDVALGILARNQFIAELEREVVVRYNDMAMREATMSRDDIALIIPEALASKSSYTLADIVTACMVINQKTLTKIRSLAIA